jgi:hypothetical protein
VIGRVPTRRHVLSLYLNDIEIGWLADLSHAWGMTRGAAARFAIELMATAGPLNAADQLAEDRAYLQRIKADAFRARAWMQFHDPLADERA